MTFTLGQWIAALGNQRITLYGETSLEALNWAQECVDIRTGAYHALGAPYGDDDTALVRWLEERNPFASVPLTEHTDKQDIPALDELS
jgi:hypothetical protein